MALLWYAVDGRKWFKGPKVNVEHVIHGVEPEREAIVEEKAFEKGE